MKRYRILFLRWAEFEEFVWAASETAAEEQAWNQLESRDDPEPRDSDTKLVAVEEADD
jgi:hypothetical protein